MIFTFYVGVTKWSKMNMIKDLCLHDAINVSIVFIYIP